MTNQTLQGENMKPVDSISFSRDDDLGKIEPGCLIRKNGDFVPKDSKSRSSSSDGARGMQGMSKGIQRRSDVKKRRGLRNRLSGLTKTGSGRKIGNVHKDEEKEQVEPAKTKATTTTNKLTSNSSTTGTNKTNARHSLAGTPRALARKKRVSVQNVPKLAEQVTMRIGKLMGAGSFEDDDTASSTSWTSITTSADQDYVGRDFMTIKIQALVRGYLCRIRFRMEKLRKQLKVIKQKKDRDLAQIEKWKRRELKITLTTETTLRCNNNDETWQDNSDVIGKLIPEVRDAREQNTKLKRELIQLKKQNKSLVLANTKTLSSAAQDEFRINRIERAGMELEMLAMRYKEAQELVVNLLKQLDDNTRRDDKDKAREIKSMIHQAEEEDARLLDNA